MTPPRFPRLAGTDATDPDRAATARLLRTARSARGHERGAALETLVEAHPGHRHARRRLIAHLLEERRDATAARLINEGLLLHPTDDGLARLRAQLLLTQGEPRAAAREIRLVLDRHPRHVGSLLLAARIAEARLALPEAVEFLERAVAERPHCAIVKQRLAETLLDAGAPRRARAVVSTIPESVPVLEARLLEADNRATAAIARLETAHAERPTDDEITTALIDLVERRGHPDRLRELVKLVGPDQPAALVRAGRAALLLGAFEDVLSRLATLRRSGPRQAEALAISAVAASMSGRGGLAVRLLEELRGRPGGADPIALADLWRRALTSRLFDGAAIARTIGVEPRTGLLEIMVHRALEVLGEPAPDAAAASPVATAHHRAACLTALGRTSEAAALLQRTVEPDRAAAAPKGPRTAPPPMPTTPVRKAA